MLFLLSILALLALVFLSKFFKHSILASRPEHSVVAFRYRVSLSPYVPERVKLLFPKLSQYVPLSTFADQANAGLTSSDFDIEANVRSGDSRSGLDEQGTREVMDIMRRERVKLVASFAWPRFLC